MSLAEIKSAVDRLSPKEFAELIAFIRERDEDAWDKQFEEDVAAGKLDHLAKKADQDFEAGRCTPL
jgi:hypothetical protein